MNQIKSVRFCFYLLFVFLVKHVKPYDSDNVPNGYFRRLFEIDYAIKDKSSFYVDRPFIHNVIPFHLREKIKHVPSGTKMHSVSEILTATLPTRVEVKNPCGGNDGAGLIAVVFVYCQVKDYRRRQRIRSTYGSRLKSHSQTAVYFVVSRVYNAPLESFLDQEAIHHDDILQFEFKDAYYNLTLKSLSVLRWSALHCSLAKFIFKFDYDGYIRVPNFIRQLTLLSPDKVYGFVQYNAEVQRTGKWAIDKWYYPYKLYPPYGPSTYLIPGNFTLPLYEAVVSLSTTDTIPALPFEDVYISGILVKKAHIQFESIPKLSQRFVEHKKFIFTKNSIIILDTNTDDDINTVHNSILNFSAFEHPRDYHENLNLYL